MSDIRKQRIAQIASLIEERAARLEADAYQENKIDLKEIREIQILITDVARIAEGLSKPNYCCSECIRHGYCPVVGNAPCGMFVATFSQPKKEESVEG